MKILHLLLPFLTLTTVRALDWETTPISLTGSTEVVAISDVAVDAAGRTHTVFVQNSLDNIIVYRLRASGSAGFSDAETVKIPGDDPDALHVSIDVTDDFTVQIAVLDELGIVRVYEKEERSSTWSETVVGTAGSTEPGAGIDILSRESGAVVYSRLNGGTNAGGVRFSSQSSDGSWSTPEDIVPGRNPDTGLAPTLIATGSFRQPFMVVSYNRAENRVEESSLTRPLLPPQTLSWRAPREIAPAPAATRPDAAIGNGVIGVSFVSGTTLVRFAEFQPTGPLGFEEEAWILSDVTLSNELEEGMLQSFGPSTALTIDAAGNPWVAYTRDQVSGFDVRTRDIRARRLIPGTGWELSIVEALTSPSTGTIQNTSALHLASGENGDPSLIYERDAGATSSLVFARPETAPWVIGRPESLDEFSETSAPALATGPAGAVHLISSTVTGVSPPTPGPSQVVTFADGEETREVIPMPGPNRAHAATVTPDGVLHVLALRTAVMTNTSGELLYFRRAPGGSFTDTAPVSIAGADVAPVFLECDGSGTLYAASVPTGGGAQIHTLTPGATAWERITGISNPSIIGMDLAVRNDGGVALSYFEFSGADSGDIQLYANFNPSRGELSEFFDTYLVDTSDSVPKNTTCTISGTGNLAVAFGSRSGITYAEPRATSGFDLRTIGSAAFAEATVSMITRAGDAHLLTHTDEDGGSLTHFRFESGTATSPVQIERFSVPGRALAPTGSLSGIERTERTALAASFDGNGFPIVAAGFTRPFVIGTIETVLLARPADALDDDGDGIPLLLEAAHCLDINRKNLLSETAEPRAASGSGGEIDLSFRFNYPAIRSIFSDGQVRSGEFVYQFEAGSDLAGWEAETFSDTPGIDPLIPPFVFDPDPFCLTTLIGFRYQPEYINANPRRFGRFVISRDR